MKACDFCIKLLACEAAMISTRPSGAMASYKAGQKLHGYTLERVEDVPELSAKAYFLIHDKTKAQHMHLWREDNNNFFCIFFRTIPSDNTGVAHVLEHLTTMGSLNYPCREIFMKMTSRSLSTYMNAYTGPDYTGYPFSTTNPKDMENLSRVYLDFVFNPTLEEINFRQEAWRLEHAEITDKESPLKFKGVVLNEMKGVYVTVLRSVLPDTVYQYHFGGDPLDIPRLSHEEMKKFYQKFYHPSNSRFFTYGDLPLENHLKLIDEMILSKSDHNPQVKTISKVLEQKVWESPKEIVTKCRPDPMAPFPDKQTTASLCYLLCDIDNIYESFVLSIIGKLLTTGQNAPFYESLIRSNLGMDYAPGTEFWDFTKQTVFSVGLQGIHANDCQKVKEIILQTFEKVAEEGFPQERIDALLHSIELSLKHQPGGFGLHLLMAIQGTWNHDGDPIAVLRINDNIERFKKELSDNPNFLKEKVRKYFIENTHNLFFIMTASEDYLTEYTAKENALLSEKTDKLTPEEKEKIYQQGIELMDYVDDNMDASCLPCLDVNGDISRKMITTNLNHSQIASIPVQISPQPTNTVVYFRSLIHLPESELPIDLKPYWPIFCELITELGAGSRDHKQMDQEIKMRTGGLEARSHLCESIDNLDEYQTGILLYSHCLERNLEAMLHLWSDILNHLRYDEDEHLTQIIKRMASERSEKLSQSGHTFVMVRAASTLKGSGAFNEICSGLSHIVFLKKLAEKNDINDLREKLITLGKLVFHKELMKISVNIEPSAIDNSLTHFEHFLNQLPSGGSPGLDKPSASIKYPIEKDFKKEHFVFPFNTNFVAKSILTVPYDHPDHAKLRIMAALLTSKYVQEEIREKGGAYGAGMSINQGGILSYFSYRDPNVVRTVKVFDGSLAWINSSDSFNQQSLNEAKLSVFKVVDKPITPGSQGTRQFLDGISDEIFHNYRLRLLDVTLDDVKKVAHKYLGAEVPHRYAVVGPKNDELSEDNGWKVIIDSDSIL
uniref:Presequence protease, mitochondrial n=1 Tax=Tetranychus urticae TaxID=32264 RepID=T1KQW8_TETUR